MLANTRSNTVLVQIPAASPSVVIRAAALNSAEKSCPAKEGLVAAGLLILVDHVDLDQLDHRIQVGGNVNGERQTSIQRASTGPDSTPTGARELSSFRRMHGRRNWAVVPQPHSTGPKFKLTRSIGGGVEPRRFDCKIRQAHHTFSRDVKDPY